MLLRGSVGGRHSVEGSRGNEEAEQASAAGIVVLAAEAMDILDTTTVNVAGPSVRRSIGGGTGLVQWLSASYTLAFAVLLISSGRLGDRYGRRRMFLLGAAGFTAASVACGLSVTPGMLIAARLVQGSFGAVLLSQGIGLLTLLLPPARRAGNGD